MHVTYEFTVRRFGRLRAASPRPCFLNESLAATEPSRLVLIDFAPLLKSRPIR